MKSVTLSILALLLCGAMHAQTYKQPAGEWACRISTFQCQNVPMTRNGVTVTDLYTINEAFSQLSSGAQFVFDGVQGVVTGVTKQLPRYWADGTYYVAYTIALDNGKTASVTSTVVITHVGRWPLAHVESTVITF